MSMSSFKRYSAIVFAVALLWLLMMSHAFAAPALIAYPLLNQVMLDGAYSSATEWSDADELALSSGISGVVAYFSAKYDSDFLYTMWDFIECQTPFTANAAIMQSTRIVLLLNPSNVASNKLDTTMYDVIYAPSHGQTAYVARGLDTGQWTVPQVSGVDITVRGQYTTSPHFASNHLVVELSIATTFGNIKSYMGSGVGAAIMFNDERTGIVALYASPSFKMIDPSSWGRLNFSQVPIPEFQPPFVYAIVPLALVFVAVLKRQARNRKDER